jgi:hypothetical protein
MPELVRYRIKWTQSGTEILRYRIEMSDAGIPMPASSASMPMPSYESYICRGAKFINIEGLGRSSAEERCTAV